MAVLALIMLFGFVGSFEKLSVEKEDFIFVKKGENQTEYAIITKESYKWLNKSTIFFGKHDAFLSHG
jgi:hypothetical protein